MDQSCSDSDLSMSPSQILERLQVLRQLQLMQRGKLQKQQLLYQDSPEISSNITEFVSHFSNSTSYNTFRSLLQTTPHSSNEASPSISAASSSRKPKERDFIDGISLLNLSQESEFILNSPTSIKSKNYSDNEPVAIIAPSNQINENSLTGKHISLDEMPILNPKKNFEALIVEKLQNEEKDKRNHKQNNLPNKNKKTFLKKGEGMSRFGVQKKDLVIQTTKSLPWHQSRRKLESINTQNKQKSTDVKTNLEKPDVKMIVPKMNSSNKVNVNGQVEREIPIRSPDKSKNDSQGHKIKTSICMSEEQSERKINNIPQGKHPLQVEKGKTWAAVLTKEQDDFLRKIKQSDYYKNFSSPSKSFISEVSCDENVIKMQQEKEIVEQKIFELLENKFTHESFNIENSFINRFLKKNKLECSGESTPLIMQRCLSKNPDLININPNFKQGKDENIECNEICQTDCTECVETCSSLSSCCSCTTFEAVNSNCACFNEIQTKMNKQKDTVRTSSIKTINSENVTGLKDTKEKQSLNDDASNDTDIIKSNMAEMNAKLIATSELLKDRLSELEDEIETFRKENANLTKMREEIDLERQKFFEEKTAFEQKFNEEKILSEYYIAEEKEKLMKQRQLYERHVRDLRGRLNKKDKDEVINLKKEINDLKEDIRTKDAKSTSTIARLRNQLKIQEKEKKNLQEEVDKLKKEIRRIQHSNDVTRRLTNLKYLEQINKKLSDITSKDSQSNIYSDPNIKYKAYEIERQNRCKKVTTDNKGIRRRAKSFPNLNVTSRYAKYFSQKDTLSEKQHISSIVDNFVDYDKDNNFEESVVNSEKSGSDTEDENNLEKIYIERFQSISPKDVMHDSGDKCNLTDNASSYFIHKSNSNQSRSTNPLNIIENKSLESNVHSSSVSHRSSGNSPKSYRTTSYESIDLISKSAANNSANNSRTMTKTPPITSNFGYNQNFAAVNNSNQYQDSRMIITPEPSTSKSSLTKTNLNPIETKKPDGSRELRFPNGNIKFISPDGKYSKFLYYNGDVKENFYSEGKIKYFYAETKTFHTTHADGLEILEFSDGQVEKRYKDGSSEIRLPNGSVRYFDPKNEHVREEWRFPDGATLTIAADGEKRVIFNNGQIEVHAKDHKRREFPDGTVKLVYNDGTAETRYSSGRVRIKDKHGNLIMDSAAS
ncbi:uncharacterized protein [Battus philenor]|uniref:uncharacterized protein n=1 Tax=Battus philenor TaxID=42288 RepID=UPI0035D12071